MELHLNIKNMVSEEVCHAMVRETRWPGGDVLCPHCSSDRIAKRGKASDGMRQRYECRECDKQFDDLTGTVLAGRHQDLKVWMLCLYFMGLNLSNRQIATELELCESDVHEMTSALRNGVSKNKPEVELSGQVEFDEVYVIAGHKGNPDAVKKKAAPAGGTA